MSCPSSEISKVRVSGLGTREVGNEGKLALHSTSSSAFLRMLAFVQWGSASVSWEFQSAFKPSICFQCINVVWGVAVRSKLLILVFLMLSVFQSATLCLTEGKILIYSLFRER